VVLIVEHQLLRVRSFPHPICAGNVLPKQVVGHAQKQAYSVFGVFDTNNSTYMGHRLKF